jgi:hypothetical protein
MSERTKTREEWLTEAVVIIDRDIFSPYLNKKYAAESDWPDTPCRVSCSWPGGAGKKKGVAGQCWSPNNSADQTTEIFICPDEDQPVNVLDTLVHENVHRWAGVECGHKGEFRKMALAVGLTGKMTSTVAGEELHTKLCGIAIELGDYPHAKLVAGDRKKQTTRMLKVVCDCGNVARQSQTAYTEFGLICGCCETKMTLET